MDIQGAIFDMDGTLIDSLGVWDVLWETFGEKYKNDRTFRPDPVTAKAVRTLDLIDGMDLLHKNCGIGRDGQDLYDTLRTVCESYYVTEVRLKDGVKEYLSYLKEKGVRICIASASPRWLVEISVSHFGLAPYIEKIFCCNDIRKGKEHPDIYYLAQDFLGTPKETTWIFEDSITALETAHGAGFHTVGIFDRHGFNPERLEAVSTVYLGEGASYTALIEN